MYVYIYIYVCVDAYPSVPACLTTSDVTEAVLGISLPAGEVAHHGERILPLGSKYPKIRYLPNTILLPRFLGSKNAECLPYSDTITISSIEIPKYPILFHFGPLGFAMALPST